MQVSKLLWTVWISCSLVVLGASPAARAQAPDASQARCLDAALSASAKLAKAQHKELSSCLKSAAKGKLGEQCLDTDGCMAADLKGKVAKAAAARGDVVLACSTPPAFGIGDRDEVADRVPWTARALAAELFGPDVDAAASSSKDDARCQASVLKSATKAADSLWKLLGGCVRRSLDAGAVSSSSDFDACLLEVASDTGGKLAKVGEKVAKGIDTGCAASDAAMLFPGACAARMDSADCVMERTRCRTCQQLAVALDADLDCDTFDDAAANDSCAVSDGRCNGHAELCTRRFNEVAYPLTHNAMSSRDEGWIGPLQNASVPDQLRSGIRGLMLDTHYYEGEPNLCHGVCSGANASRRYREALDVGLARITQYLAGHPGEVVSIIFESYISEADTAAEFAAAGLDAYVHSQTIGEPWPTLAEMIAADRRLVVFTDDSSASLPWHHYTYDWAWETPFHFEDPAEFTCAEDRGTQGADLYIVNHFLTAPAGSQQLAQTVNFNPLLVERMQQCEVEGGQIPNFLAVDFADVGDVLEVADTLNGVAVCTP